MKNGSKIKMTAENSNWEIGEVGIITFVGSDRVGVYFPERGDEPDDDYTALVGDFEVIK